MLQSMNRAAKLKLVAIHREESDNAAAHACTVEQDQALDVWCDPQQARAGMCPMSAGQRINALYSACMSQQLVDGRVWPPHASHQLNSKNSARFVHACG